LPLSSSSDDSENLAQLKKEDESTHGDDESSKMSEIEGKSDESIENLPHYECQEVLRYRREVKGQEGNPEKVRTRIQGRKKRLYESLEEKDLAQMTNFIYNSVWQRMKKLPNVAAGVCAQEVLTNAQITDEDQCKQKFSDTGALKKNAWLINEPMQLERFKKKC